MHEGCAPPPAQNFFIFLQFRGKIGQITGWRPPLELAPLIWEILDPPLDIGSVWLTEHNLILGKSGSSLH